MNLKIRIGKAMVAMIKKLLQKSVRSNLCIMRKLYTLTLILFIVSSCIENENNISHALQKKSDSLKIELEKVKSEINSLKFDFGKGKTKIYSNEKFNSFFWNFMTDSTFQISRIKFPMKYITWKDELGGDIDTIKIKKPDWKYDSFYINKASERTQIYDNFNLNFRPSNERVLHWYGVESGGDIKYYFIGFDRKWYLTKKEQLGD